jgi:hypothetical protein
LVVAAPPGVQLCSGSASDLGDAALDGCVNVFVSGREHERVCLHFGGDHIKRSKHGIALSDGHETCLGETSNMRTRPVDVIGPQATIERKALGERHEFLGRAAIEPTVPERF